MQFRHDTAGTHQDHRPRFRVSAEAYNRLSQALHHGLHQKAGDARGGSTGPHARQHRGGFGRECRRVGDIQRHTANLRLMRQIGRQDFERDGVAQPMRHGIGRIHHDKGAIQAESRENPARIGLIRLGGDGVADGRRWGLGPRGAPVEKGANDIGAGFRGAEGGYAGFAQKPQGRIGLGHQKGRDGFAKPGLHRASNACHRVMWAELCGRSHHGKHHIRARVCRKRCQRRFHLIGPRAGKRHVNHPPMMWQVSGGKAGHGSGIGRAGFNADNTQSIHRHSAATARCGHDGDRAARIG